MVDWRSGTGVVIWWMEPGVHICEVGEWKQEEEPKQQHKTEHNTCRPTTWDIQNTVCNTNKYTIKNFIGPQFHHFDLIKIYFIPISFEILSTYMILLIGHKNKGRFTTIFFHKMFLLWDCNETINCSAWNPLFNYWPLGRAPTPELPRRSILDDKMDYVSESFLYVNSWKYKIKLGSGLWKATMAPSYMA